MSGLNFNSTTRKAIPGVGTVVDNRMLRFDGTTGDLIQSATTATLDDTDNFAGLGYVEMNEISAPGAGAANTGRLYVKDDASETKLFFHGDGGSETQLGAGIAAVVDDTSPQLGGNLDPNTFSIAGGGTLELLSFVETGSAVNELTITNAATGNAPSLSATGDDTNISLNLVAKGSGVVQAGGVEVVTLSGTQTLTNKTVTNLTANGTLTGTAVLDDDTFGTATSDTVATSESIKAYVDSVASGLDLKDSCRAATTAALPAVTYDNGTSGVGATLTADANGALPAQDGVTLVANDRILVKDQAAGLQNGIYEVTQVGDGSNPFILTRTTDADTDAEVTAGMFTFIEEGTTNADAGFVLTTNNPITIGTTALSFTQFSGAGQITAGAGLTKSGNTLDVGAGTGITVNANDVEVDTTVVVTLTGTQTLTNKTLTTPVISSISNTGTLTLPTSTDTLVGRATTDTFTNKTFDANGTGNSLSNVDVADLANGTDGELITWDAAGAPATVAVGTAGQVLTSNGAGAAPTFQAAAGTGDFSGPGSSTDNAVVRFDGTTGKTGQNSGVIIDDSNNVSGIADLTFTSSLNLSVQSTAVNANTNGAAIVLVTDTSAARTITLDTDDVVAGRVITVKDQSGGAGTNNITIATEAAETIDGNASVAITVDYGVGRLVSDGTNWFTL